MKLASVISETKEKAPDLKSRIQDMQIREREGAGKSAISRVRGKAFGRGRSATDRLLKLPLQELQARRPGTRRGVARITRRGSHRSSMMPGFAVGFAAAMRPKKKSNRRPQQLIGVVLLAISAGYFLGSSQGARPRHMAIDKVKSKFRRGSAQVPRSVQQAENNVSDTMVEVSTSNQPAESGTVNDQELAHKVESELFRNPSIPKGQININAEEGVVYLRGTIESEEQSQQIGAQASGIDGVVGVKNLLHAGGVS